MKTEFSTRRGWSAALGLLALLAFSFDQFPARFVNTDSAPLEALVRPLNGARLFLDGVRPYYIQRAVPDSRVFYDLNTRLQRAENIEQLCPIAACFRPDHWVISRHQKSTETYAALHRHFRVTAETDNAFVADRLLLACPASPLRCNDLTMKK